MGGGNAQKSAMKVSGACGQAGHRTHPRHDAWAAPSYPRGPLSGRPRARATHGATAIRRRRRGEGSRRGHAARGAAGVEGSAGRPGTVRCCSSKPTSRGRSQVEHEYAAAAAPSGAVAPAPPSAAAEASATRAR
eukprot:350481-Chlamydomonas_euryale.AAC.4